MIRAAARVRRVLLLAPALLVALLAPAGAQEAPRQGGVLRVAMIGEPPSLDLHTTTAVITKEITWHVYETLYTFDRNYAAVPLLAEGHTIGDRGRTYTIKLRRGVKFHHGKEMTAADVVASLQRWRRVATMGKVALRDVESIEATDPHTVTIRLKEPFASLLVGLGRPGGAAAIYPREVVEAAGEGQIREFIGTGPFRFVEHRPDRHIKLARFKDYAPRGDRPDGYGGLRAAHLDEILFIPTSDVAVRVAGIETGEFHYAQQLKQDHYDRLKANPRVTPIVVKPYGWAVAVLNHKQGLMTDRRIRRAFQAALDMEPILAAGYGNKAFYRADPGLMFPEQPAWHSRAGAELYNQRNPAKARRLLQEAGYAGQPVRWITTKEYEAMYKLALVARQQLEAAGFAIDLQVIDWATLIQRRNKPELYEVSSTFITFTPDPAYTTGVECNWPGWWCLDEKNRWTEALSRESDPRRRRAMWEKVQALFYEDVGRIKFGDFFTLDAARKEVRGVEAVPDTHFWNVWLAR